MRKDNTQLSLLPLTNSKNKTFCHNSGILPKKIFICLLTTADCITFAYSKKFHNYTY